MRNVSEVSLNPSADPPFYQSRLPIKRGRPTLPTTSNLAWPGAHQVPRRFLQ